MRRLSAVLSLVTMAVAAALAADPEFLSVYKAPDVTRLNFAGKTVAALVITDDQSLQVSGEEALTRELNARGVKGLPTYRFVPRPELKSAEKAKGWFERRGVEGVVALRPVSRETFKDGSPVVWTSGYYPSLWGYYGYGWSNVYVVSTSRTVTSVIVETLVYDATRDKLVWAGTSETQNPKNLQEFVKDLVAEIVKEMKKMKMVG
jgi:hypothetical protein